MALIRDNDDERRARVEALIRESVNAHRHTSAQGEELAPPITSAKRLDTAPNAKRVSHALAK